MTIRSQLSRLLWREAEAPAAGPTVAAPRDVVGVPEYLRKALRFTVISFAATVLTSQIIGVQFPAYAAPPTGTNPNANQNAAYGQCVACCARNRNIDRQNNQPLAETRYQECIVNLCNRIKLGLYTLPVTAGGYSQCAGVP